jgi:hypothetical protein
VLSRSYKKKAAHEDWYFLTSTSHIIDGHCAIQPAAEVGQDRRDLLATHHDSMSLSRHEPHPRWMLGST